MAKTLIFRNATTTGLASVVGTLAELWVDTTLKTVVVMDGVTSGGTVLARNADLQNLSSVTYTNLQTVSSNAFIAATTLMTNSIQGIGRPDTTSLTTVTSGVIAIATGSNGYGARTVQSSASGVPSNSTGNNGDIIYQY